MSQIEEEEKRNPPAASEVMSRAIILTHLFVKAYATPPPDMLREWINKWSDTDHTKCIADFRQQFAAQEKRIRDADLWNSMDESEREFMQAGPLETTLRQQIDASWSVEAIACLQWALGRRDQLPTWDQQVDPESIRFAEGDTMRTLIETASLRPASEVAEMREISEGWHWRCRTRALIQSGRIPAVLKNGTTMDQVIEMSAKFWLEKGAFEKIICNDYPAFGKAFRDISEEEFLTVQSISQERHKALNWLCGYAPGNRWTDTPTHT